MIIFVDLFVKCSSTLPEEELDFLKKANLSENNDIIARDMFLLSYYGRGINFIDLMQLKKRDLYKETITYKRSKTGVIVNFKLNEFWKQKISEYASPVDCLYIFNIIHNNQDSETYINNRKEKFLKLYINNLLKKLLMIWGSKRISLTIAQDTHLLQS